MTPIITGVTCKLTATVPPQANQEIPLPTPEEIATICNAALANSYQGATVAVFHKP